MTRKILEYAIASLLVFAVLYGVRWLVVYGFYTVNLQR